MPVYTYKAVTRTGVVVRNKVESSSRQNLIKSLKKMYYLFRKWVGDGGTCL